MSNFLKSLLDKTKKQCTQNSLSTLKPIIEMMAPSTAIGKFTSANKIIFTSAWVRLVSKKGKLEDAGFKQINKISEAKDPSEYANVDNEWLATNAFAWPFILVEWLGNMTNLAIDTLDKLTLVKLMKYFHSDADYQGREKLDKHGSLFARSLKLLVSIVKFPALAVLSVPLNIGKNLDAWLDKRAESARENAAAIVVPAAVAAQVPVAAQAPVSNAPAPANQTVSTPVPSAATSETVASNNVAPVTVKVRPVTAQATVEPSQNDSQNTAVAVAQERERQEQKVKPQHTQTASTVKAEVTEKPGHRLMVDCPPTDRLRRHGLFHELASPPSCSSEAQAEERTTPSHSRTSSATAA